MDQLNKLFDEKKGDILSLYFTAGYPSLNDTGKIIRALDKAGVDMIEIGLPFSDPLADGPVIQASGSRALQNGMNMKLLFRQLGELVGSINCPLLIMMYYNQLLQFGVEKFLMHAKNAGISGLIIPDLPMEYFENDYRELFKKNEIHISMLICPTSSDERIRMADDLSTSFLYMVADSSVTGIRKSMSEEQIKYFDRVSKMSFEKPRLLGFGISNHETYRMACRYADGAIIGSAFIDYISRKGIDEKTISEFVHFIRYGELE